MHLYKALKSKKHKRNKKHFSEWTYAEKKLFKGAWAKHGKNWELIAEEIGTRDKKQVKAYYKHVRELWKQ